MTQPQRVKAHIHIEQHTPTGAIVTDQHWELAALTLVVSAAEELAEINATTQTRKRTRTHERITTRTHTHTTEERHSETEEETGRTTRQLERGQARPLQ